MCVGSTAPIVYPRMSSVKQLAAWNSSSSAKLNPGAFLSVNLTACSTWSTASLCSPSNSRWGQTMATSCGSCMEPPSSPMKHGAILLAQLAGKPRQEGRDSADKIYTNVALRVGPVGDHNFHWGHWGHVLGSHLHSPWLLRLARREIGRNHNVAYRGIQSLGLPGTPLVESASRCTAQLFCKPGSVKLQGCMRKYFFYCIDCIPQPQFSRNRHEEAGKLVLYGRQRDGKFSLQPQVWEST